ncbi:hypothetical protein A33M_1308 [Rhodovulum sp. PH10]|nr:hypothetical protein A33M_1308 [Rhodovulum sp. PH10]
MGRVDEHLVRHVCVSVRRSRRAWPGLPAGTGGTNGHCRPKGGWNQVDGRSARNDRTDGDGSDGARSQRPAVLSVLVVPDMGSDPGVGAAAQRPRRTMRERDLCVNAQEDRRRIQSSFEGGDRSLPTPPRSASGGVAGDGGRILEVCGRRRRAGPASRNPPAPLIKARHGPLASRMIFTSRRGRTGKSRPVSHLCSAFGVLPIAGPAPP